MNINTPSLASRASSQQETWDSAPAPFSIRSLCSHRLLLPGPSHTNTADTSAMSLHNLPTSSSRQVLQSRRRRNTYPSWSWSRSNSRSSVDLPEGSTVINSRNSVHSRRRGNVSTVQLIGSPLDTRVNTIDSSLPHVAGGNVGVNIDDTTPMAGSTTLDSITYAEASQRLVCATQSVPSKSNSGPPVFPTATLSATTSAVAPTEQEAPLSTPTPTALSWGRTTSNQSSCLTPPQPICATHATSPPPDSPLLSPADSGAHANFASITCAGGIPAVSVVMRSASTALTNSGFLGPTLAVFTPRLDSTTVASDSSSLVQQPWRPPGLFRAAAWLDTGLLPGAAPSLNEETIDDAATTYPFVVVDDPRTAYPNREDYDRRTLIPSSTAHIANKTNRQEEYKYVRQASKERGAAPAAAFKPLSLSTSHQPSSRQRSASAVSLHSGDLRSVSKDRVLKVAE